MWKALKNDFERLSTGESVIPVIDSDKLHKLPGYPGSTKSGDLVKWLFPNHPHASRIQLFALERTVESLIGAIRDCGVAIQSTTFNQALSKKAARQARDEVFRFAAKPSQVSLGDCLGQANPSFDRIAREFASHLSQLPVARRSP